MKGYPISRFEIVDQSTVSAIETATSVGSPIALYMQPYTSDKGSEDWELLYGFDGFTDIKGGISFSKHGQAQLTLANSLVDGAYVLAKRMVSLDATLANVTIKARVIQSGGVSYLYLYGVSAENIKTFKEACEAGYGEFDPSENAVETDGVKSIDIPLFTITPMGRGVSALRFKITPNYSTSKASQYTRYTLEITENNTLLETMYIAMNSDINLDGVNQSLQSKVSTNSKQIKAKIYEDGFLKLVTVLAETVTLNGVAVSPASIASMDYLNGKDIRGINPLENISTSEADEIWVSNKPADLENVLSLDDINGIGMPNGSYGSMGTAPIKNAKEYENMLLYTFGSKPTEDSEPIKESALYKPVIYDVDNYKIDCIFDCNYPMSVKNAIIDLVDFRGDMIFFADLGTVESNLTGIIDAKQQLKESKFLWVSHVYGNLLDRYTKKEITVTLPYLMANRMIGHISNGVGKPVAGLPNNMYFPEFISGTINFVPVIVPGEDQKQKLVDTNINYVSYYDQIPVLETMYINYDEYTQLSFLQNIMAVQEVIKIIRTRCPQSRYTFLSGDEFNNYLDDVNSILNNYATNFKSISMTYAADENFETNKIFYAYLKVTFKDFIQEEYFKIYALSNDKVN